MNKINRGRLLVGGLVASLLLFLSDGFLHERLVLTDWQAVYAALGAREPQEHQAGAILYFIIFELGRGFLSIYLYALMRACCGPGPKTAVLAGIVAWLAFTVTGPAQFIPLGFYSHALWLKVGAFQLVTSMVATIVAAWLYRGPAVEPAT